MRTVAILTGPYTHLDHLGVLSCILNIPLIITEEHTLKIAQTFYPHTQIDFKHIQELSLDYLAAHYDQIFETGAFWASQLAPFIDLLYNKKMRFVYCPHGNSDKGGNGLHSPQQDIALVYGKHLHDLLTNNGSLSHTSQVIYTGNYRYHFYVEHKKFYDDLTEKYVFSHFAIKKPIILYAPTWHNNLNPHLFFAEIHQFITTLSADFNVIVKFHPFLIEDFISYTFQISDHYRQHPSVLFLEEFPAIYPLLAGSAIYLGDHSSIGYDFLTFDRPLYFIQPAKGAISSCGIEIPPSAKNNLGDFINHTLKEQALFSHIRQSTYRYAFEHHSTESPCLSKTALHLT